MSVDVINREIKLNDIEFGVLIYLCMMVGGGGQRRCTGGRRLGPARIRRMMGFAYVLCFEYRVNYTVGP